MANIGNHRRINGAPDFEDTSEYSITIIATSTRGAGTVDGAAVNMYASLPVTVKVVDAG